MIAVACWMPWLYRTPVLTYPDNSPACHYERPELGGWHGVSAYEDVLHIENEWPFDGEEMESHVDL
jgi:hypothetical protein